jgi:hypothetical protein
MILHSVCLQFRQPTAQACHCSNATYLQACVAHHSSCNAAAAAASLLIAQVAQQACHCNGLSLQ